MRWCNHCDFGFLDPRPSAEDLARFHERDELASVVKEARQRYSKRSVFTLPGEPGHSQARQIDAQRIQSVLDKQVPRSASLAAGTSIFCVASGTWAIGYPESS